MKLIIVESPTKCHTIGEFLGKDYKIVASKGHIRDLSTSGKGGLGVDVDHGFKPTYIISKDKLNVVKTLKNALKEVDDVYLATDPDREGEAIAWHLKEVLGLPDNTKRMEFHEITSHAVKKALANPRTIDMNLVESQETRRIMDRIIGFKLSGLLNSKIKSRSAGRVQSVTLRLVVDHEREIKDFVPEEYYEVEGIFSSKKIKAKLVSYNSKSIKIKSNEELEKVKADLPKIFNVLPIVENERVKEPKPAFTTSTMQQEAYNSFGYTPKETSSIAQKLYEGVEINGSSKGLITYMRTDSTRLAPEFIELANQFIISSFGVKYKGRPHFKSSKNEQDGHEAIRPTDLNITPDVAKKYLPKKLYNLYKMIYSRALASLMSPKVEKVSTLSFEGNSYVFKTDYVESVFDGYAKLYEDSESSVKYQKVPSLDEDKVEAISIEGTQHFTKAPSRYSEAKLVKLMEEKGIGRPSTYASTIELLKDRKYITSTKGVLSATDQGELTVDKLVSYFPTFMDYAYTASMENKLDEVVSGDQSRVNLLSDFYKKFIDLLDNAYKNMEKIKYEETGETCPKCGKPLVIKKSRYGEFIACSGYPECDYIKKEVKEVRYVEGRVCPECGSKLIYRKSKRGEEFIGCSAFPKCHYVEGLAKKEPVHYEKEGQVCPKCGKGHLVAKSSRYGTFYACSNYPECKYTEKIFVKKAKKNEN